MIIFGLKDFASLAHFYLDDVVAFTADEKYCIDSTFEGLPVIPFETIENEFPNEHEMLLPINDNKIRAIKASEAKKKGFKLAAYIHPTTIKYGDVGDNCFVLENNIIQPYTTIGNNVIMWTANHIGHHSVIGNNVFVASHVVVCGHCTISDYAWLGANCTIRDGKHVGEGCIVGMNSAVINDTEKWSTYYGVPAKCGK